jgi:hypothetical protein
MLTSGLSSKPRMPLSSASDAACGSGSGSQKASAGEALMLDVSPALMPDVSPALMLDVSPALLINDDDAAGAEWRGDSTAFCDAALPAASHAARFNQISNA